MTEPVPESDQSQSSHAPHFHHHHQGSERGRMIGGYILILLGTIFLLQQFLSVDIWRYGWPILLIVIGLIIIVKRP